MYKEFIEANLSRKNENWPEKKLNGEQNGIGEEVFNSKNKSHNIFTPAVLRLVYPQNKEPV